MRTTVEITDEQRAKLVMLAARRGQKGFSGIVRDAIDHYLNEEAQRLERVAAALDARGALAGDEGDEFQLRVADARDRFDREHR